MSGELTSSSQGSRYTKIAGSSFSVEENRNLGHFGETRFDEEKIVINPKRGDVVNTIIHERIHEKNPEMSEREVIKKSGEVEASLSLRESANLLKETADMADSGNQLRQAFPNMVFTQSSKVIKRNIT
jgi:hypothetical protein